ncbi:twin-arginine translocase subunit TatC [Paenibacillus abyssi]|uniref:Sec-independent protein translocase protein TatC n=1 Tax=Paenibacillus abyssi TaxID=1340531 RepID=A0A917LF41_9BACL|nr:twin-arginine translocase subunit TatC [Paenibacillus abyssi]GGG16992.1 Sec-independent protein translocase protein TatCy [Paenibacillus abyssi]
MNGETAFTLMEHVTELRKRLLRVVLVLVGGMAVGFIFARPIFLYFMDVPPANAIALNVFNPWDAIKIYMNFALLIGLIPALPFAMYQLWAFLKPGLRNEEQGASLTYIPFALLLFLAGLAFGYFIVFKMAFHFTTQISASMQLVETYGVAQYFSFMFNIVIPVSLLFELPVVVMFLTNLRLLNPDRLRKGRRYAYLLLTIIATVITPPDLISAIIVGIPMILLYEVSVYLSGVIYKRQLLQEQYEKENPGVYAQASQ